VAARQLSEPTPLGATLHPTSWDDGARVSPDARLIFFSATHYPTAGGVWGKPDVLDQMEELSMSSLRAFHAGPQNGSKDIYWIKSTIIEDRRGELAPKTADSPSAAPEARPAPRGR
jgi:hypothetical protein